MIRNTYFHKKYPFGFSSKMKKTILFKNLNKKTITLLSKHREDPHFIKKFRLKAFKKWQKLSLPDWTLLDIQPISYKDLTIYAEPKNSNSKKSNTQFAQTFNKLGLFLNESTTTTAIDAVFDSISIKVTFKKRLAKYGIIFCSLYEGIKRYPCLIQKYLGTVVPSADNFFACLNAAIFSDGTFCYIPQNTTCPMELSTYFRINDKNAGQFERTLIIAEKNSKVIYYEGCTASANKNFQLHAAVVELIALTNAEINYSTIQNWYSGTKSGKGGIYNFVTKRGLCLGYSSKISWTQIETGSNITWKYPSCILLGDFTKGDFYSTVLTKNNQQSDSGTKMIHLGKNSESKIISKGISSNFSTNIYRGLVKVAKNATNAKNYSQCDSFLLGNRTYTLTLPYFEINNSKSIIEHEASLSKLKDEQLFFLQSRGFTFEKAINLLINGFCKEVLEKLPLEFTFEAQNLLKLSLTKKLG